MSGTGDRPAGGRGDAEPGAGDSRPGRAGDTPAATQDQVGWQRLDARVLALHLARLATTLAPVAVVVALGGGLSRSVAITVAAVFGVRAASVAGDALRWRTTRYRVTDERVELRSGLARRAERSVPRDRVRTVNVTAKPLHRLFGLATVEVGTGRHRGTGERGGLVLDAIRAAEAEPLRTALLARAQGEPALDRAVPEPVQPASAPSAPIRPGRTQARPAPAGRAQPAPVRPGRAQPVPVHPGQDQPAPDAARPMPAAGETLARLRWSWLPYDVLSPWTLVLPLLALAGGVQLLDTFGVQGVAFDAASDGAREIRALPAVAAVVLVAAGLALAGVLAAAALFVESWWGFALTRERDGTLRVRRGLLTARSLSIEQRRLRGVELGEPLLLRAAGGATLHALASGLRSDGERSGPRANALLPSVPRETAEHVAAAVLRDARSPGPRDGDTDAAGRHNADARSPDPRDGTAAAHARAPGPHDGDTDADADAAGLLLRGLRPHPRAALRRRRVRAAAGVAMLTGALALAGPALGWLPAWAWAAGAVSALAAWPLAHVAYRALGHGVGGRYLLARSGALVRRTRALERDGVIGWTVSRSLFQRRAGLATLTATTAAGSGGYRVLDVGHHEGLAFAEEATPGMLGPFVERSAATSAPSRT